MTARSRPPAFAGRLYPAEPARLEARLELARSRVHPGEEEADLALLPHGGIEDFAEASLVALAHLPREAGEVVLLGPLHDPGPGEDGAVVLDDREAWEVPTGRVELVDPGEPSRLLRDAGVPVVTSPAAHDREHALEVVAALLAWWSPGSRILPLLLPARPEGALGPLLERVAGSSRRILATTDLDHYHEPPAGRERHAKFMDLLADGDPGALRRELLRGSLAPCGGTAAWAFLHLARRRGQRIRILAYAWAGDVPGRVGALGAIATGARHLEE